MTPQQEKAMGMIEATVNTAQAISNLFEKPIANIGLLSKRTFRNRSVPHRVKRKLKQSARTQVNFRNLMSALTFSLGYSQMLILNSQPIPKYEKGSLN